MVAAKRAFANDERALRWLHLSDLHLGCAGRELWWQVESELQPSLRDGVRRLGPPDLVLLTGDLTNSGTELALVDELLATLFALLRDAGGGPEPLLVAVPGNHDLLRPVRREARSFRILDDYERGADDPGVGELIEELWVRRDPSFAAPLFAQYQAWLEQRVVPQLERRGAQVHLSHFPGDLTVRLDLPGRFPLLLVGLNSAWRQYRAGDDFEGHLELPAAQFHAALASDASPTANPLAILELQRRRLLLVHHPESWLSSRSRGDFRGAIYPPGRFDLCLHGHLHQGSSRSLAESGGEARRFFQAPSLFGLERYGTRREERLMGYTWGRLTADGELRVWPLRREVRGDGTAAFVHDSSFHGDPENGVLLRPADSPAGRPAARRATRLRLPRRIQEALATPPDDGLAAYRTLAAEQYSGLSLLGLGGGDLRLRFEEVYVPLRISRRPERLDLEARGGKRRSEAALAEAAEEVGIEEVFKLAARAGSPHVAIFGDPGAGKTTALLKLHHLCLTAPEALGLEAGTVPVLLRLRRFSKEDLDGDPKALLRRQLDAAFVGKLAVDIADRLWGHGRLLLLLDGLDEVADEALRAEVCRFLEWTLADPGRPLRAAVSCRYSGYGGGRVHLGKTFLHLDVKPLDAARCRELADSWFRAAGRTLPDYPEREARAAAARLKAALDGGDYASQQLKVLVGSPLLLTLLCIVVQRGGEMPRQRVEFYDQCLRVLLGRWSRAKADVPEEDRKPPLDVETALAVLRALAYDLHREERRGDLPVAEIVVRLEERLAQLGQAGDGLGFRVLDWLHRDTGVVDEFAAGRYGFAHLGFEEYLAALHMASQGEEPLDDLARRFGAEGWREIPLLLVGLPGRRLFAPLLARLLRGPALLEQADLLRGCLEEAAEVDLAPFLELLADDGSEPVRQAAVLRLLAGRGDPRLLARAAALAGSDDADLSALARRVAEAASERSAGGASRAGPRILMLCHPADRPAAGDFVRAVRGRGLDVELAGEALADAAYLERLVAAARGVAVLVGPEDRSPWETDTFLLKLFARRRRVLVPVRLPGQGGLPRLPEALPFAPWVDLRGGLAGAVEALDRAFAEGSAAAAGGPVSTPGAGQPFVEPVSGVRFLWIPGGRFQMGGDRFPDEQPVHRVRVSPFWLGETPVTNGQYTAFLKVTGHHEPAFWRGRRYSAPDQPVVGVSWDDALAFCRWLAPACGRRVTLPSEAQWEFAARGTDGREYPWGDEAPDATRASFGLSLEGGQPAAVGSFPAGRGPFGALDQAGNVWEWCLDAWDEAAYRKRAKGAEPVDPMVEGDDGAVRVLRGGGWFVSAVNLRAAYRLGLQCFFPARFRRLPRRRRAREPLSFVRFFGVQGWSPWSPHDRTSDKSGRRRRRIARLAMHGLTI
jgi:formylglycine-generating enzyme required for sulfatase activity/predicted MPP superfamily phosphohydrolase